MRLNGSTVGDNFFKKGKKENQRRRHSLAGTFVFFFFIKSKLKNGAAKIFSKKPRRMHL
jgi:hypothetical protein